MTLRQRLGLHAIKNDLTLPE